jgi:NAD(P)-dependent dehydrogenase (short-subunit alcohol dehydrogenase family)
VLAERDSLISNYLVPYLIVLGATAPLPRLRHTLRSVCSEWDALPVRGGLRDAFPDEDEVVALVPRDTEKGGAETHEDAALLALADALISHRHTVTAPLRRVVQQATERFGHVRLLVQEAGPSPPKARHQMTTLAGFLRSGRVIQDGVLLTIVEHSRSTERRSSSAKSRNTPAFKRPVQMGRRAAGRRTARKPPARRPRGPQVPSP